MANIGIAPPDYSTMRGKFRLLANDTYYVDVPNPGLPYILNNPGSQFGDYTLFSDNEIDAYLVLEPNVYRAVALAYLGLANTAARQAESIKDYDLAVDSRQKAEQLRAQADAFFAEADRVEAAGGEGFQIVSTGRRLTRAELAELNWSEVDYTDWIV